MKLIALVLISLFVLLSSCTEDKIMVPKPRMFPKVIYPVKDYINFKVETCPFKMKIPKYFEYAQDTFHLDTGNNKCWFDLYCKDLNAYLHLSYLSIDNRKHFDELVGDAFELADKHNIKANYRDEIKISNLDKNLHGLLFEIDGPVATPIQFFVSDSTQHFFRGSLYFKSKVNRDSLAPIYSFLKDDVVHLLDNFSWD